MVLGRTPLTTLYKLAYKVGGPMFRLVTTEKPISSRLQHYPVIFELIGGSADVLECTPSLISD
jgi:hypothetical protein